MGLPRLLPEARRIQFRTVPDLRCASTMSLKFRAITLSLFRDHAITNSTYAFFADSYSYSE